MPVTRNTPTMAEAQSAPVRLHINISDTDFAGFVEANGRCVMLSEEDFQRLSDQLATRALTAQMILQDFVAQQGRAVRAGVA